MVLIQNTVPLSHCQPMESKLGRLVNWNESQELFRSNTVIPWIIRKNSSSSVPGWDLENVRGMSPLFLSWMELVLYSTVACVDLRSGNVTCIGRHASAQIRYLMSPRSFITRSPPRASSHKLSTRNPISEPGRQEEACSQHNRYGVHGRAVEDVKKSG